MTPADSFHDEGHSTDGLRMSSRDEVEFRHLGRILGGVGARVPITGGRLGSAARSRFEAHIALLYDRPGCFAYVGWPSAVHCPTDVQLQVYGAFAKAAVATRIYLGGLEPAEGFGLACWREPAPKPMDPAYDEAYTGMMRTVEHALHILNVAGPNEIVAATRIALGCGRLRGSCLFGLQSDRVLLDGPRAVETLYGDIPNRCGGIAKGKDPVAKKLFGTSAGIGTVTVFRQPWTHFYLRPNTAAPRISSVWSGAPVPADLIEQLTLAPIAIPAGAPQPFLIGLSLDFAKSSLEFGADAHRARSVVDRILTDLENLASKPSNGLYVSPRYGDGVAAVVATEAADRAAAMKAPWFTWFQSFLGNAGGQLGQCKHLGLRIGLAVELDNEACTARLAGLSRHSSPAVEPIAQKVIDSARSCHNFVKNQSPALPITRQARVFVLNEDEKGFSILPPS